MNQNEPLFPDRDGQIRTNCRVAIHFIPSKILTFMIGIKELRKLNPQAWTGLLTQDSAHNSILVTAVESERLDSDTSAFRYVLSLEGYYEPISLIGKKSNVPETLFYGSISRQIPEIAPHSWISHLEGNEGWVIHEECYNDFSPMEWTGRDFERILDRLVSLHATMWDKEEELAQLGFIRLLGGNSEEIRKELTKKDAQALLQPLELSKRIASWERGDLNLPSDHAISSSGNLGIDLIKSALALEKIAERGGWPGVFEDEHRQTAADLLDDPLPLIYHLDQLPLTLIHGDPKPQAWRLDLLNRCQLPDWKSAKIGPPVYDLVCFIVNLSLVRSKEGTYSQRVHWPISEETVVDSYILAMGRNLESRFSPALLRQAIPAAECLYILTVGIPTFANWIIKLESEQFDWHALILEDYDKLSEGDYSEFAAIRSYWSSLFARFLSAYRSL